MTKKLLQLKRRAETHFLTQFTLERRTLARADPARGIPAIRAGVDSNGHSVLIKTWPRNKHVDDADLREIWRNELRHLHRLAGHRGVSDYIVELRASAVDNEGYHLVLSPGQRRPLELHLGEEADASYRLNPASVPGRRLIWANLFRIARGLDALHSLGLLHRNLTTWSILTACDDEPDFQLTGFEWSMRISAQDSVAPTAHTVRQDGVHSFLRDWQQLAVVAIRLFGIEDNKIRDIAVANQDVAAHLNAAEVQLIRQLAQIFPSERIDGQMVADQVAAILTTLTAQQQNQDPAFHLVLPLGAQGPLAAVIRTATGLSIEIDDVKAQQEFIENDLSRPIVVAVKDGDQGSRAKLVLRGERLTYELQDFHRGNGKSKTPSKWELAYCASVRPQAPPMGVIIKQIPLSSRALTFMRLADAKDKTYRLRGRVTSWSILRQQLSAAADTPASERLLIKSLVLTQMLEYLFAASDVFPVSVSEDVDDNELEGETRIRIAVRPRQDVDRDDLSKALELKNPPAIRLANALTGDRSGDERQTWILTDSPGVGDKSLTETEWQFEAEQRAPNGERIYIFSGDRPPSLGRALFLVPGESAGRDAQLRRRMRSFNALAEHRELSRMLVDPRIRLQDSHETIVEDAGFASLDSSKQAAFRAAVETLPLFLVQGPPGVGKTRLVCELVRQVLTNDKSHRLLLSAQSNYAVDHLLAEIKDILSAEANHEALIVRCAAREREEATQFDIDEQTKSVLKDFLKSELYSKASIALRERAANIARSYGLSVPGKSRDLEAEPANARRRSLEHLVLRAANLVFATTNSSDLERLIDERSQFDWVIIEEAAKATGTELVSPLLLSPRRLMIGDHKQLPPFDADRLLDLLKRPEVVKKAHSVGDPLIGRTLRDRAVEEVFADISPADGEKLADLCQEAIRNFSLFQSIIENEFDRQKRGGPGRPIATALAKQHRMHPAIARIVSVAFYDKELLTDETREKAFLKSASPVSSLDVTRLPDSPDVWIDMPWIQPTIGMKYGERFPRFINPDERSAVQAVLRLLTASGGNGKTPTLAILSPYSRQVDSMAHLVQSQGHNFKNLRAFHSASKQSHFCNTVDSFQGSEADCVVISLVRNNQHGSIHAALGFLADARRMNVLMSRAKWRLILVGSLDFLRNVDRLAKSAEDQREIAFLGKLLGAIDAGQTDGSVRVIPVKTLLGSKA
ncbi:MAG: AAA domain-containing protein [Sulfuricaulis sp.]